MGGSSEPLQTSLWVGKGRKYGVNGRKKPQVWVELGSTGSQDSWVDRSPRWENPVAAPPKPGSTRIHMANWLKYCRTGMRTSRPSRGSLADIGASLADNGGGGASLAESGVARTSHASCTGGGGNPALSRRSLVSLTAEGGTHDGPKLLGCTCDSRHGDSGRDDLCPGGGFASKNPVSDRPQGRRTHNSPYRARCRTNCFLKTARTATRARSCAGRRMRPLLRRRIECGGREVLARAGEGGFAGLFAYPGSTC
ncbi:hypothetical protein B0H11DRAFT_2186184 [Mycena galericulata]|nr:hypothetical protein B0H11DRAFT_2186184 [Mycena galericulata]